MTIHRYFLACGLALTGVSASGQSITVLPVSIQMAPGESATTLTIINSDTVATSVQVRAFAWSQSAGTDLLSPSNVIVASPPIATIPAHSAQVVRLVLRQQPTGKEATYRVVVDQIPPPAEPGTVRIALRMSIPIFAQPRTRTESRLAYRIENKAGKLSLVAVNGGARHETLRTIDLSDGLTAQANASPYVLAGATRRWPLMTTGAVPAAGSAVRLTASADTGGLDQPVAIIAVP